MTTQQQGQQLNDPLKSQKQKQQVTRTRWLVATIALLLIAGGAIFWLRDTQGSVYAILPIVIFTVLGVLVSLFQWLFPVSSNVPDHSVHIIHSPPLEHFQPAQPVPVPIEKSAHRGIVGFPPLADSRTIQQREHVVREVYSKLMQDDITAIALTGIGGVGKSTLAALVYRYMEEQRYSHTSPFLTETLWITVDPAVTFADLAGNLFEALGKPLPDLGNLAPQNQAVALFNALNSTDEPRLIVLDQFENLLDWDTGHALTDRPGVGEWLDIINSRPCACRILLTSRPRPVGTREYPPTCLQEYAVGGLEMNEGIALLQSQGVQGTEAELQTAVSHCAGHAFSLTLLATLMRDHHIDLKTLFKSSALWTGDIATNLLDQIYSSKLNDVQRELLLAFSVYREPVAIEATLAVIARASIAQISLALKTMVTQHLIEAEGEGCYQLHAIIADYVRSRFDESNPQTNEKALQAAHARAAEYYLQHSETTSIPRENRRKMNDVHDLIEAVWQYCQAGKWQQAYSLMQNEDIFHSLNRWGGNVIPLELYKVLLPSGLWNPDLSQATKIYNNLGWIYNQLGQKEQSQKCFEKALQICKQIDDRGGEGTTLSNLGWIYSEVGYIERAREILEQALNICREVRDRDEESRALNNLGRVYSMLGQLMRAQDSYEQALKICKEIGNRGGEGWALNNLGKLYNDLGDKKRALEYLNQALHIRKAVGNRPGEGRTLKNLGSVYCELGKKEEALHCLEEALRINKEVGDLEGEGMTSNKLGMFYCNEVRGREGEGMALYKSDLYCESLEHKELALKYYTEALNVLKEAGHRRVEGMTLNNIGLFYAKLGQKEQAQMYYKDALQIFKEIGGNWEESTILHNVGMLYFKQHRYSIALAGFLLAKNISQALENPFYDEVQIWIEKIQSELGDEQFAALLATVEPRAQEIVDQALNAGME